MMFWLHVWYATPTDTITHFHSNVGHVTYILGSHDLIKYAKKLQNPANYVMRRCFMTEKVVQKQYAHALIVIG